ncbi:MAG: cytochrome c family protein [Fimbriimonadaceae bacterium]
MKLAAFVSLHAALAIGAYGLVFGGPDPEPPVVVVFGGDTDGYLSPCGCTKPMSGGIRRRATAVRQLTVGRRAVILENGGLISGQGRQDELKAEALAEALRAMNATAIHFGLSEARLGPGLRISLAQLTGGRLVQSNALEADEDVVLSVAGGPFLIGGVETRSAALASATGRRTASDEDAVRRLVDEGRRQRRPVVVMLQGSLEDARRLARIFPEVALIQYRSAGDPPARPHREGNTVLVTPGEKGKHVVRMLWTRGGFSGYGVSKLNPEFDDDGTVAEVYRTYLARVAEEGLLDKLPRLPSEPFAGSQACYGCHRDAFEVWQKSAHARALATLEADNHDRDPDCTGCHVVGLDREGGFRSRRETPKLADVGCESCHGPSKKHSLDPYRFPKSKVGPASCLPCHNADHSPKFDYETYWKKIAH